MIGILTILLSCNPLSNLPGFPCSGRANVEKSANATSLEKISNIHGCEVDGASKVTQTGSPYRINSVRVIDLRNLPNEFWYLFNKRSYPFGIGSLLQAEAALTRFDFFVRCLIPWVVAIWLTKKCIGCRPSGTQVCLAVEYRAKVRLAQGPTRLRREIRTLD